MPILSSAGLFDILTNFLLGQCDQPNLVEDRHRVATVLWLCTQTYDSQASIACKYLKEIMKTALILTGQPRFTRDFSLQLDQITSPEPIDLWCLFWLPEELNADNLKRSQRWIPPSWPWDPKQAHDWLSSRLPPHVRLARVGFIDPQAFPIVKEYPEFYCNGLTLWRQYQCLAAMEQWLPRNYDMIIRSRADLALLTPVDLAKAYQVLEVHPRRLILPDTGRSARGFCDQWNLGLDPTMRIYMQVVKSFDQAVATGIPFNAEHMISWRLQAAGIEWPQSGIRHQLRMSGQGSATDFLPDWGIWC
jgi:hypothetical protein